VNEILVRRTYAGLLLGRPKERINQGIRASFEAWASSLGHVKKPFVIEPRVESDDRGGQRLPDYSCAVRISHNSPAHDKNRDISTAVIVWYQQANPMFGAMEIVEELKNLTWVEIAEDGDW
jgi:hypothetical protein